MINRITCLLLIFLVTSCSYFTRKDKFSNVEFDSIPSGASIYNGEGKEVAKAPLKYENFKEFCDENSNYIIGKDGYYSMGYHPDCKSSDKLSIKLIKKNVAQFKLDTFGTYYKEMNTYSNKLLQIQYKLIQGLIDDAYKDLVVFKDNYPNIASVYIMLAQIELQKGQIPISKEHLNYALRLDSNNTDAIEMLASIDHPKDEAVNDEVTAPVETKKNKKKLIESKKNKKVISKNDIKKEVKSETKK